MMIFAGKDLDKDRKPEFNDKQLILDRVFQVDLVPSLCMLLGLPIPDQSVGKLLPLLGFGDAEYSMLADHFKCQKCDAMRQQNCSESRRDCISKVVEKTLKSLSSDINDSACLQSIIMSGSISLLLFYKLFKATEVTSRSRLFGSLVLSLIYSSTMGASSYIENEHATCYFLASTILFAFTCDLLANKKFKDAFRIFLSLVAIRVIRTRNVIINFGRLNFLEGASDADTESIVPSPFSSVSNVVLVLVMIYFCFNSLQDLNLRKHSNIELGISALRFLTIIASLCCILICKNLSDNVVPARLAYFLIFVVLLIFREINIGFLLLLLLIHREANVLTIVALFFVSYVSFSSLKFLSQSERVMVLYLIGRCGFYSLGNSHSVSSIDVAGGYTGLVEYVPAIVALITYILVLTGQIISVLPILEDLGSSHVGGGVNNESILRLAWEISFSFFRSSLLTYAMKNHLFVWTVFAPRLCYEGITCFSYLVLLISLNFFKVGNNGAENKFS